MRNLGLIPLLALLLAVAGCSTSTDPERRSLIGEWTGAVGEASVTLTLSEAARTVTGTGRYVAADRAQGFRVEGTHAEESVAMNFEFEGPGDLNFLGEFVDEDEIRGTIVGDGLRGQPVSFLRVGEGE